MACIRKRRGRYVVDYREGGSRYGKRRCPAYQTRKEAEERLAEILGQERDPARSLDVTLSGYVQGWLVQCEVAKRPNTYENQEGQLRNHILPALGSVKLSDLRRPVLAKYFAGQLRQGRAPGTVSTQIGTLSTVLTSAVEDGVLESNPCQGIRRRLKIAGRQRDKGKIKAFDKVQLGVFLAHLWRLKATRGDVLRLMVTTGLRSGEAEAVRWEDLDLASGELMVSRTCSRDRLGPPKTGARRVDLPPGIVAMLKARRIAAMASGTIGLGWVFPGPCAARPVTHSVIQNAMRQALMLAGLPAGFSPHCLRHYPACRVIPIRGASAVRLSASALADAG